MTEDPNERREREFDAITFLLAGVLSAIVLGAVGYGIFKSPREATVIPPPAPGLQTPVQADRPPSEPNTAITGSR
jgi:hypothetical protein